VKDPKKVWEMWHLSQAYGNPPSVLLALRESDPLASFYLDRAVMHFGRGLEADLDKALDQGKRKKPFTATERARKRAEVFERWFDEKQSRQFRDPQRG
jgi:hypothetical protein